MTSQSFIDTLHIDCGFFDQCVVNLIIPAINVVLGVTYYLELCNATFLFTRYLIFCPQTSIIIETLTTLIGKE